MENKWSVIIPGRDEIHLKQVGDQYLLSVLGCPELLDYAKEFLEANGQDPHKWSVPQGLSHAPSMFRELVLKFFGQFELPFAEAELCHCRVVQTQKVWSVLQSGPQTQERVSRLTMAGTGCGSCQRDTAKLIAYSKGQSAPK